MAISICPRCMHTGDCIHKWKTKLGSLFLYVNFVCFHCLYEEFGLFSSDYKEEYKCPFCHKVFETIT